MEEERLLNDIWFQCSRCIVVCGQAVWQTAATVEWTDALLSLLWSVIFELVHRLLLTLSAVAALVHCCCSGPLLLLWSAVAVFAVVRYCSWFNGQLLLLSLLLMLLLSEAAATIRYCCCCSFRHDDGVRLEEQLQLRHLEQLRYWFENHRLLPPVANATRQQHLPWQRGRLNRDDFKQVIAMVIGSHDYDDQLDSLFTKVRRMTRNMHAWRSCDNMCVKSQSDNR